jgi:hypothetical protein
VVSPPKGEKSKNILYKTTYGFQASERVRFVKMIEGLKESEKLKSIPIVRTSQSETQTSGSTQINFKTANHVKSFELPEDFKNTEAYRCFVIFPEENSDIKELLNGGGFITGIYAKPTDPKNDVIHHALLHIASPEIVKGLRASVIPGTNNYECQSGPVPAKLINKYSKDIVTYYQQSAAGITSSREVMTNVMKAQNLISELPLINTYVPGSAGLQFPENSGIPIRKGSALVIQAHYQVNDPKNFSDPGLDVAISHSDSVKKIALYRIFTDGRALLDRQLLSIDDTPVIDLPANSSKNVNIDISYRDIVGSSMLRLGKFLPADASRKIGKFNFWSFNPHMHSAGRKFRVLLGDDSDETEAMRVDNYFESWQRDYILQNKIVIDKTEFATGRMRLSCDFTNERNFRVVGGYFDADEMCLMSTLITFDFE